MTVVSDRIARAVSKSGATRALVIDISWFDHAGLFHKLQAYGISGQVFGLISSFFGNRQLRVVLNWKSLQEYPVLALFRLCSVIDSFEWFWIGSLCKNIQLMLVFLRAPFLILHFSYPSMTFLILFLTLLYMLIILLSTLRLIRHMICSNN